MENSIIWILDKSFLFWCKSFVSLRIRKSLFLLKLEYLKFCLESCFNQLFPKNYIEEYKNTKLGNFKTTISAGKDLYNLSKIDI